MSEEKKKSDRGIGTKVGWQDVLARVEKNQGVPKKTVQESFKAVVDEIKTIIPEIRPTGKEVATITTPIAGLAFEKVPAHVATDKAGQKWNISESVRVMITPPEDFALIANEGFSLTRKKVTAK